MVAVHLQEVTSAHKSHNNNYVSYIMCSLGENTKCNIPLGQAYSTSHMQYTLPWKDCGDPLVLEQQISTRHQLIGIVSLRQSTVLDSHVIGQAV